MQVHVVTDILEMKDDTVVIVDGSVVSTKLGKAGNGSAYLDVTLGDVSNELKCKIWGVSDSTVKLVEDSEFIRVSAKVGSYNGKKQLVINKVAPIPAIELEIGKLKRTAPFLTEELVAYLEETIEMIEDKAISLIVKRRYKDNKEKFIIWPAARSMHHNYETGLLYHTVSMLKLARNNLSMYPAGTMDKDILLGAIILHDMDKITEYSGVKNPQFTEMGSLMGHVFMSGAEVFHLSKVLASKNPEVDQSKVPYLIHAILGHHGKLEWGSPVKPITIEAEIVHQIDMMDSRMNHQF